MGDGIITSRATKKIKVVGGVIYAMWGSSMFFEPAIAWHQADAKPADIPKGDGDHKWALIVIDENFRQRGVAQYVWEAPYPDYFRPPWAFGANQEMAYGLMVAGKTAEETVKIMCEHTVYADGKIQVVNIAEALGQLREAAE